MQNVRLLLTSAIDIPPETKVIHSLDERVRETHYALKKWSKASGCQITLVDNTSFDLEPFVDTYPDIEFMQTNSGPYSVPGFGEFESIRFFLENQKELVDTDYILKVNARYFVRNINSIIRELQFEQTADVCCILRNNLSFADTRVIAAKVDFWKNFCSVKHPELKSGEYFFENAMARKVLHDISKGSAWSNFRNSPVLQGSSAATGNHYGYLKQSIFRPVLNWLYNKAVS